MKQEILPLIKKLTEIPSPTGYTYDVIDYISDELTKVGYSPKLNHKGGLIVTVDGNNQNQQRLITAHVDTLGAMVKEIKEDGRLTLALIGHFNYNAIEGENCLIHTQDGQTYTGTILLHQTSIHVYKESASAERNQKNMEIRLDEEVGSKKDVLDIGIQVGDFISFDPRTIITTSGFIKSRHLDDKVSVAILLDKLIALKKEDVTLPYTTHFLFSNNEEIGYGGNSNIGEEVVEYLAVDMGAMGDGQTTDEYTVSICAKDSSGPYHLKLRQHLVELCKCYDIAYQVDLYPFYGSDASAAIKSGADIRHGLIGAGIESSHAYERTHITSIIATQNLIARYLMSDMI